MTYIIIWTRVFNGNLTTLEFFHIPGYDVDFTSVNFAQLCSQDVFDSLMDRMTLTSRLSTYFYLNFNVLTTVNIKDKFRLAM